MASLHTFSKSFPGWVFFCCCCCLPLLLTSSLPLKGASAAHHACRLRKTNFQQLYIRNRTYTLAKMVQSSTGSSWWDLRTYSSVGAVTSSLWHSFLFPLPFSRKKQSAFSVKVEFWCLEQVYCLLAVWPGEAAASPAAAPQVKGSPWKCTTSSFQEGVAKVGKL